MLRCFFECLDAVNKLHVRILAFELRALHIDLIRFLFAKNINHEHSQLKQFIELRMP